MTCRFWRIICLGNLIPAYSFFIGQLPLPRFLRNFNIQLIKPSNLHSFVCFISSFSLPLFFSYLSHLNHFVLTLASPPIYPPVMAS